MKKQYRVRITTYYPSFVVEAENEEQAKQKALTMPWPDADACSFFEVVEDDWRANDEESTHNYLATVQEQINLGKTQDDSSRN
jgi:hypothetical protein